MVLNSIEDHRRFSNVSNGAWLLVQSYNGHVLGFPLYDNHGTQCAILTPCDEFACLPRTEVDWENECRGFIENCKFPCAGPWDGFHVHVGWRLKNYFSFKSKYMITSMDLITHNKRLLHLAGAPALHKKSSFLLRIFSVNVIKSAGNCGFGHIY